MTTTTTKTSVRQQMMNHLSCRRLIMIAVISSFLVLTASACEHDHDGIDDMPHYWHGALRKHSNSQRVSDHRHLSDTSASSSSFNEDSAVDDECGYIGMDEDEMAKDLQEFSKWKTEKSTFDGSYNMPTYFHVIQPEGAVNFVTESRINHYMTYLNNAFAAGMPLVFNLMGITRTINSTWSNDCYRNEISYKTILKVGGMETLNIYICKAIPSPKGGAWAGYAYFPTTSVRDGVVIAETGTLHDIRPNTLVHETGHYMGLPHTFNGQNTCEPDGDGIEDTPRMISRAAITNCRTTNMTLMDSCPDHEGLDPVDNYMTYSNDNTCRTRFTDGQIAKILYTFQTYRYSPSSAGTGGSGGSGSMNSTVKPGGSSGSTNSTEAPSSSGSTNTSGTSGGTSGSTNRTGTLDGCFSSQNTVDVLNKGLVPVSMVKIGDYVRGGNGKFTRVYSLGHIDHAIEGNFLQIYAEGTMSPLEITSSHMLFVSGKSALASQVVVGDMLGEHRVKQISTVKRRGVYAPVTYSGDILVNGVLASCYVSLLDGVSARLQNPASHAVMSLHRMVCQFDVGVCESETYTNGVSDWLVAVVRVVTGVNQLHGSLQLCAYVISIPLILLVQLMENLVVYYMWVVAVFFLYCCRDIKYGLQEERK